jgi:hypothetical protein
MRGLAHQREHEQQDQDEDDATHFGGSFPSRRL